MRSPGVMGASSGVLKPDAEVDEGMEIWMV